MLQLKILNGQKAGAEWTPHRFPVRIGRAPDAHLRIEEPGVWDTHLQIDLQQSEGFLLLVVSGALVCVNGHPVERAALRNGDVIELSALKLQFGLSPTRHRDLRLREALTWLALALLCLGQVALIYWLPN